MDKKILNILLGAGLFLIVATFNPFFSAGLYFDSTAAYTFISAHKVILLGILDSILMLFWFIQTVKTKQLKLTSTKAYIPAALFVLSAILSTLFSINKLNSTFGFNSMLGTSLIETFLCFVFFLYFINNIRTSDSVVVILRYLLLGFSLSFLWLLFRYASNDIFHSIYLRDYANSRLFSPLGGHNALIPVSLIAMCLSSGLFILNLVYKKRITILILDGLNLSISTLSFFNFATIEYKNKNYFFLVLGLLLIAFLAFLFTQLKNLKIALIPILVIISISVIGGVIFSKTVISKNMAGFGFPKVATDASFSITLDSMKDSFAKRGLFGLGQGNFTYAFDQYKSEATVANRPLTVNNGSPMVGEIRANNTGNYMIEVFFGQGLLGLITFLSLAVFVLYKSAKKLSVEFNLLHLFATIGFGIILLSLFVQGYENILVMLFWILAAVCIVLTHEGETQKDFDISINGNTQTSGNNLNFILPLFVLCLTAFSMFHVSKIANANISMFWGKVFQSNGNLEEYRKSSFDAVSKYQNSDIFMRELVNGNAARLVEAYVNLQKEVKDFQQKVTDNPQFKDTKEAQEKQIDLNTRISSLNVERSRIVNDLSEAARKFPDEYKNYYMLGILQSAISELTEYSLDIDARNAFETSNVHNKYHPATHYQLALIYERNKEFNKAFANIELSYQLNPNDIALVKYADISAQVQDYDRALTIYKGFRTVKEQRSDIPQVQDFYKSFDIDKKIEAVEKLIQERDAARKEAELKQQKEQSSPTPTAIPTITPTK